MNIQELLLFTALVVFLAAGFFLKKKLDIFIDLIGKNPSKKRKMKRKDTK